MSMWVWLPPGSYLFCLSMSTSLDSLRHDVLMSMNTANHRLIEDRDHKQKAKQTSRLRGTGTLTCIALAHADTVGESNSVP